eukprot:6524287-Prymnesium_polylepis.1
MHSTPGVGFTVKSRGAVAKYAVPSVHSTIAVRTARVSEINRLGRLVMSISCPYHVRCLALVRPSFLLLLLARCMRHKETADEKSVAHDSCTARRLIAAD